VYRTLLLRVDDAADAEQIRRFEHATLQMPEHIRTIVAWQLSTVRHAEGSARWTHVWEQEFPDVDGLLGPYMHHPIHWGHVDRWFDPECPERIVKDRVCHSFCAITTAVIDATPGLRLAAGQDWADPGHRRHARAPARRGKELSRQGGRAIGIARPPEVSERGRPARPLPRPASARSSPSARSWGRCAARRCAAAASAAAPCQPG